MRPTTLAFTCPRADASRERCRRSRQCTRRFSAGPTRGRGQVQRPVGRRCASCARSRLTCPTPSRPAPTQPSRASTRPCLLMRSACSHAPKPLLSRLRYEPAFAAVPPQAMDAQPNAGRLTLANTVLPFLLSPSQQQCAGISRVPKSRCLNEPAAHFSQHAAVRPTAMPLSRPRLFVGRSPLREYACRTRSFSSGPAHEARSAAAACWTAP